MTMIHNRMTPAQLRRYRESNPPTPAQELTSAGAADGEYLPPNPAVNSPPLHVMAETGLENQSADLVFGGALMESVDPPATGTASAAQAPTDFYQDALARLLAQLGETDIDQALMEIQRLQAALAAHRAQGGA